MEGRLRFFSIPPMYIGANGKDCCSATDPIPLYKARISNMLLRGFAPITPTPLRIFGSTLDSVKRTLLPSSVYPPIGFNVDLIFAS